VGLPGASLAATTSPSYAANSLVVSGEWLRADMGKPVIVVPILVVVSLVVMSMAVSGAALTGNDLLPACRDFINKQFSKGPLSQGQCIGMIDALAFAASDSQISRACVPDNVTVTQATTVVVRWLDKRPQDWHLPFSVLVLFALHDTWPCQ